MSTLCALITDYTGTDDSSSKTTIVATRCEFANNTFGAGVQGSLTSAKFNNCNNCVFNENQFDGIQSQSATIHLHREATAAHSNGGCGIAVYSGQVLVHLPSHHNTFYNNGSEDRYTGFGGSTCRGTITNVHVED